MRFLPQKTKTITKYYIMKTKLLLEGLTSKTLYSLLLCCLCLTYGWSQNPSMQIIGEFPEVDGGMEAQTADATMSSAGSSQAGTAQETWTVSSTGNSSVRTMDDDAALARTGTFSAEWAVAEGKTNVRLQSPSPTSPAFTPETEYTIQFFYKSEFDPGTDLDPGVYLNNTSSGSTTNKTDVTPWASNTWTKTYGTKTLGAAFNASNWAVARISTASDATGFHSAVRVDDFVVYAGGYDDMAPSDPTGGSYDASGNIAWSAPVGGVDGGGYVVFKYSEMPSADNDPNQNGIYQVGSATTNGTGSITGTVVYIGETPSFTDTYSAGTYYKIYAVDKAFNYSNELNISDATLSVSQNILASKLNIYPNPAQDYIQIDANDVKVESVEMFSLVGQKVISKSNLINSRLDISNLGRGIYLLKVNANDGSLTTKIIVE
ncbi:T9SS type A sorting domain-containing protein [Algibacter amylolyticus]|uniref:T9SS type A sorting domain-containing protein n=2 Tax=Algibacter amylolyticus TaxID=1608400 RepID=A0A5M7BFK5_9FLAO|nr:T9SS type A sorting domain-containing protein [Algibacter amylolyticus]TSJ80452.1 T9SS type A sorting domain-containing protein [Algibacter amylolyticus]